MSLVVPTIESFELIQLMIKENPAAEKLLITYEKVKSRPLAAGGSKSYDTSLVKSNLIGNQYYRQGILVNPYHPMDSSQKHDSKSYEGL